VTWNASPENVEQLKKHIEQFIALSTGGPSFYDGKDIKAAHADMHITNAEFDAAAGDLKATMDKLQVPDAEQKELLAVIETTREQIVTVR
jgi:hemoglobin